MIKSISIASKLFPTYTYDVEERGFWFQQPGYLRFYFNEGYIYSLLDALANPKSDTMFLYETFRVTEDAGSLILKRFSNGGLETLLKLGKATAKRWSNQIEEEHRSIIHSYTETW